MIPSRAISDIVFLLVARVQFAPSAALEVPLRNAMSRIAAEMRKAGPGQAWPGASYTLGSYIRANTPSASRHCW